MFLDPSTDGDYHLVVKPSTEQASASNAEIVKVTAKSGDSLTVTRAQQGTTARDIAAGWDIYQDALAHDYNDLVFNQIYVDQSGGTGDVYGALSGTINGTNTTFTVSQTEYISGSLQVYLNGQLQTQGTSEDYDETTPSSGTFDFNTAPESGDEITVTYWVAGGGSLDADTVDGVHASSFATLTGTETLTNKTIKQTITRQDITTDSTVSNCSIVVGWGIIEGNDTSTLNQSITFPSAFASPPIVVSQYVGGTTSVSPDTIDDFTTGTASGGGQTTLTSDSISTTGFKVCMNRDTSNFGNAGSYAYSWIAIGVLA